ncbi:MAG TPA: TIGR03790 family protein [Burkholderiales bacterium]|nr:TIGR03790 family protein [Burkholderiales bacterium]
MLLCLGAVALFAAAQAAALDRRALGLVVNDSDPLSVEIGRYYAERRGITFQNVIRLAFAPGRPALGREEFDRLKRDADAQAGPQVQAYALAWALPYRVECMSITSAFAFGYDPAYCEAGCGPTMPSRYFDSASHAPFSDFGMRPAMALAARSLEEAKRLIDRGVASDGTRPEGTGYLLSTSDARRNVRAQFYPLAERVAHGRLQLRVVAQDALMKRSDVLFYVTGVAVVSGLESLRFRPGALADTLTSAGGMLDSGDGGHTTALRWLEAGATASYGTVVEPCNRVQKFPHPAVLIARYLEGDTAIEAYWKSVQMPGQGVFAGEPLAAPYR